MSNIVAVTSQGVERVLAADEGITLMEILRGADIEGIQAICGGCMSCATCHVYIAEGDVLRLSPATKGEEELLDSLLDRQLNSRLSCQIEFRAELNGLRVTIPPT